MRGSNLVWVLFLSFLLSPSLSPGQKETKNKTKAAGQSTYQLQSHAIGSAGAAAASSGIEAKCTLGQSTPIGTASADETTVNAGFWKGFLGVLSAFDPVLPRVFENALYQNFPNPFNPLTTIRYSVAKESSVEVVIYNVQGRKVRTLLKKNKSAGEYRVVWDGKNDRGQQVATGVYFCRLKVDSFVFVKKMILLK